MDYKKERFAAIYPNYLDSTKTIQQGRRLAKHHAVETPTCQDIGMALQILKRRHVVQPYKGYSRDTESRWDNLGRVLVDLESRSDGVMEMQSDGTFDADIPEMATDQKQNKKRLLRDIARIIPNLPARTERLQMQAEERAAVEKKTQEEAAAAHRTASAKASSSGGASGGGKKKGKKRR
jgi:signal recognition particle subunit SRP19